MFKMARLRDAEYEPGGWESRLKWPAGRIAETDEMKGLILLLASPAASYLTGTVIAIDGGTTA